VLEEFFDDVEGRTIYGYSNSGSDNLWITKLIESIKDEKTRKKLDERWKKLKKEDVFSLVGGKGRQVALAGIVGITDVGTAHEAGSDAVTLAKIVKELAKESGDADIKTKNLRKTKLREALKSGDLVKIFNILSNGFSLEENSEVLINRIKNIDINNIEIKYKDMMTVNEKKLLGETIKNTDKKREKADKESYANRINNNSGESFAVGNTIILSRWGDE